MIHRRHKLRQRKTARQRGYDWEWQKFRKAALSAPEDYGLPATFMWCQDCLNEKKPRKTPTQEIHHIIRIHVRPDLKYAPHNLMGLCKQHHNQRTARGE